jgi:hypothetical protein
MIWTGQDPYLTNDWILGHSQFEATWISDPNFLYPLPLALVFAPLGWLPLYYAFIVWVFLLESMIFFSAISLINLGETPQRKHFIVPVLVSIVIFRPTIIAVLNGQISGLLLLIMVCVILLWSKKHSFLGGAFLAIVALKPNIGIPILALISLWLLFNKKINALVGIAVSGFTLAILGIAIKTNWISEYLSIGSAKLSQAFGYSPTLWGLATLATRFNLQLTLITGGGGSININIYCHSTRTAKLGGRQATEFYKPCYYNNFVNHAIYLAI